MVLDGSTVELKGSTVSDRRAKQVQTLLIGHLVNAFRRRSFAPDDEHDHSTVRALIDESSLSGEGLQFAGLQYLHRTTDELVRTEELILDGAH